MTDEATCDDTLTIIENAEVQLVTAAMAEDHEAWNQVWTDTCNSVLHHVQLDHNIRDVNTLLSMITTALGDLAYETTDTFRDMLDEVAREFNEIRTNQALKPLDYRALWQAALLEEETEAT